MLGRSGMYGQEGMSICQFWGFVVDVRLEVGDG